MIPTHCRQANRTEDICSAVNPPSRHKYRNNLSVLMLQYHLTLMQDCQLIQEAAGLFAGACQLVHVKLIQLEQLLKRQA